MSNECEKSCSCEEKKCCKCKCLVAMVVVSFLVSLATIKVFAPCVVKKALIEEMIIKKFEKDALMKEIFMADFVKEAMKQGQKLAHKHEGMPKPPKM